MVKPARLLRGHMEPPRRLRIAGRMRHGHMDALFGFVIIEFFIVGDRKDFDTLELVTAVAAGLNNRHR